MLRPHRPNLWLPDCCAIGSQEHTPVCGNGPTPSGRRVTGHATVDIVLKHYFKPDRQSFRRVLATKMPACLAGGQSQDGLEDVISRIRAEANALTAENFHGARERILSLPHHEFK